MDDASIAFWTRVVWSHPALKPPHRFLLLAVAYVANPAGNVTMTHGELAALMNVDRRTVFTALKAMEGQGLLEIRPGSGQRQGVRDGLTYQLLEYVPPPLPTGVLSFAARVRRWFGH
jgi:hypothetical protein